MTPWHHEGYYYDEDGCFVGGYYNNGDGWFYRFFDGSPLPAKSRHDAIKKLEAGPAPSVPAVGLHGEMPDE